MSKMEEKLEELKRDANKLLEDVQIQLDGTLIKLDKVIENIKKVQGTD